MKDVRDYYNIFTNLHLLFSAGSFRHDRLFISMTPSPWDTLIQSSNVTSCRNSMSFRQLKHETTQTTEQETVGIDCWISDMTSKGTSSPQTEQNRFYLRDFYLERAPSPQMAWFARVVPFITLSMTAVSWTNRKVSEEQLAPLQQGNHNILMP